MQTLINAYQKTTDEIRHVFIKDGKVHKETVKFKPFLGYHCDEDKSSWTDIYGKPIKIKRFSSISEMNEWKKNNSKLFEILGDVSPVIQFIATTYRDNIPFTKEGLKIFNIDIEVLSDGFPKVNEAKFPINAITINEMISDKYYTFSYASYIEENENETFIKCKNEIDLLDKFINFWKEEDPQIITGWNCEHFDIPYLINRIINVMGIEHVNKLSYERNISKIKKIDERGNEIIVYNLSGHILWDYMALYKKYTPETRESYSLDNIAKVELGDAKIAYHDEYENLSELFHKDPQKFIRYNIKDTNIVKQLEDKLAYIDLALTIMQKAKCQPEQIFKTVGSWDCIIYNELLSRKMLCPANKNHQKIDFIGGYVLNPIPGLHKWLKVYDIVSSYPNQIRSGNFSPETIIPDTKLPQELRKIKDKYASIEKCIDINSLKEIRPILKKYNVSFSSNGYFFDISKEGIIPSIFSKLFEYRKEYKRQLKEFKEKGMEREAKIADLFQYTMKILLNSGYGYISNIYSRYFDIRIAEAITSNGQVCCRGAIKHITDKFPIVKCVYADTDSNFYSLEKVIEKRFGTTEVKPEIALEFILKFGKHCIEPELKNFFKQLSENLNFRQLTIGMEAECIADVTLFVAKKKYIMNKIWDEGVVLLDKPKRKIRGVEIVRSSTPMIVRDKLKEAIDIIFKTQDNNKLIKFIEKFKKEFKTLPIETVAFPRSVTFGEYTLSSKSLPIGVKSAFLYNEILKMKKIDNKYPLIQDGDKIKFCYIIQPNLLRTPVIGFLNKMPLELKNLFMVDYEIQFEKAFIAPLKIILDAISWQLEPSRGLDDFFS